jgi:hypothetical protein
MKQDILRNFRAGLGDQGHDSYVMQRVSACVVNHETTALTDKALSMAHDEAWGRGESLSRAKKQLKCRCGV